MMKLYLISSTAGEFEWLEPTEPEGTSPTQSSFRSVGGPTVRQPRVWNGSFIAFKVANICCREMWRFVRFVRFGFA